MYVSAGYNKISYFQYSTATKMPEHLLATERFQFLFKLEVRMRFDAEHLLGHWQM